MKPNTEEFKRIQAEMTKGALKKRKAFKDIPSEIREVNRYLESKELLDCYYAAGYRYSRR
jgi:hypothetical protein